MGDRFGQRLRFLGADNDEVNLGTDKLLDLGALLERIVLGVSSGYLAAAARMSAFICTRQGSPRLHCDMPMTSWRLAAFVEAVVEVLGPPDLLQPLNRAVASTSVASIGMGAYFVCIIIMFGFVNSQVRLRRWANTAATMITPVNTKRPASGTALMLRILSR
jgi:hypothetical protein